MTPEAVRHAGRPNQLGNLGPHGPVLYLSLSFDMTTVERRPYGREQEPEEPELATLNLEEMGPLGDTMAPFENGRINVFGGIPGEKVVARIVRYRRKRRRHVSAIVTEVVDPSPHRVAPPCPYFGPCSGCQWQHIDYPHQLDLKRNAVRAELEAYEPLRAVPVSAPTPAPEQLGYRNHGRFTVRRSGRLGFVNRITRRFVDVDRCMLMADGINDVLSKLDGRSQETSQLSIRYGVNTSDVLVQPALSSEEIPLQTGQTHYTEELLGRTFRIASPSFFQVNTAQAERLSEIVRQRLKLRGGDTLIDAYAGVGTFAALLAPHVARVIAVEESEAAVKDAAVNTLGLDNLEYRQGRTEDVIAELDSTPDAVILDPPRVGCDRAALEAVAAWRPRRTAYVSCDPASLARDLAILVGAGLNVIDVQPVDMFPQTHHVECVVTLGAG